MMMNFMARSFGEEDNMETQIMIGAKFPSPSTAVADLSLGLSPSSSDEMLEKEHMFDKVVTPSDVGKLNRLVIPKQHAERYFPLDSSINEKGLLLNFEDRNGKPWRFRYSYWNSSQSYVMTKGWSRFVKEKKLDAGDVVSFQRGTGEIAKDRLFIDWRRRQPESLPAASETPFRGYFSFDNYRSYPHLQPWNKVSGPSRDHAIYYQHHHQFHRPRDGYGGSSCNNNNNNNNNNNAHIFSGQISGYEHVFPAGGYQMNSDIMYLRSAGVQTRHEPVYESIPVMKGKTEKKRLRLFGVNMDCPLPESGQEPRLGPTMAAPASFLKGKSSFDLDI